MCDIIKQDKALKIDCGDFLCECPTIEDDGGNWEGYSCQYIKKFVEKGDVENSQPILLSNFGWRGHETWSILQDILHIDVEEIKNHFKYECPWTKNTYYRFYPDWILAKDVNVYHMQGIDRLFYDHEYWSGRFYQEEEDDFYKPQPYIQGDIAKAMMGHGYDYGVMPNDGGGDKNVVAIELSNGDLLIGFAWIWFNK